MKNRIIPIIAFLMIFAVALSACKSDENPKTPETTTETTTTRIYVAGYTYNESPDTQTQTVIKTTIPPPSRTKRQNQTVEQTETKAEKPTKLKPTASYGEIEKISNGVTVITKTSPVSKGTAASIIIYGTPNKTYSIEFYENADNAVKSEELSDKTADNNGFASWTFKIGESCESGNKKIIVREKNSNKFVQTSITVQ